MKTNLLFTLLLALFYSSAFSQNTYIPDDNFEQALIDLGLDSGELNDSVPTAAIDTVTNLNVHEKNITDMTGIKDFSSLVGLWCYNNNIAEIDLSGNVLLEKLYFGENPAPSINLSKNPELILINLNKGQFTELDLSGNTKLERLYCNENNLTELDFRNNPQLFRVHCYDNQLINIDVSQCPKLEDIRIYSNQLTEIDLTNNPALKELQVRENLLTSIDFSSNINLETVYIYQNQLTEIDVSMCPNLKKLQCNDNAIISVDISNNPKMEYLLVSNNQLTELNLKNGNIQGLTYMYARNNPNLTCISVDDEAAANAKKINNWSKDAIANFSENCGHFTTQQTYIPDDNFEQALIDLGYDDELNDSVLTGMVQNIVTLNLRGKNISDLTGIKDFKSLEEFNCSSNDISAINELPFLINLKELWVQENELDSLNVSSNTQLDRLICGGNPLTSLNVENNTKLEDLQCGMTQIASLDLQTNVNLKKLICFSTPLTELNLLFNPELEELNCNATQISDIQFPENSKLKSLTCHRAKLTQLDVSALDSLNYLLIYENELVSLDLSNNPKMRYLDCTNNNLSELNLKNGNIAGFERMYANYNPNLDCIQVDDVTAANGKNEGDWLKDNTAVFSENCGTYVVPKTYVPDDNFEQALIDLGWDSGELDDSVATAKINERTYLDIVNKNITDLTGIEDFAALDYLNMQNNQVTSINVSKNQNLKKLWCNGNPLSSLNLSNNPGLEDLQCRYTNITELILPENSKLKEINCESCQLNNLDVSGLDSLQKISLYGNNLSHLDLSANMKLEDVRCANNQLETLLLPENGLLKRIECQDNKISKLAGILDSEMEKNATIDNTSSLTFLNVLKNNFVFADFEPNWEKLTMLPSFFYNNQNPVGVEKDTSVVKGNNFNLLIEDYTSATNDQFQWYKNQNFINGENGESLVFNPTEYNDAGKFHCVITNPDFPELTLHSHQVTVLVTNPVGVSDFEKTEIKIYPNPATNYVNIDTKGKMVSVFIFNQLGQNIFVNKHFSSSKINIEDFNPGIYFVKIKDTKNTSTFKILKK